jgi:hypothetical protein
MVAVCLGRDERMELPGREVCDVMCDDVRMTLGRH